MHIPHQPPMLWIDPGSSTSYRVPGDHPFLRDGFLLRTAMIELLAQSAACQMAVEAAGRGRKIREGRLAAIGGLTFHGDAAVGETLTLRIIPGAAFGKLSRVRATVHGGGRLLAEAEMTFHVELE